MLYTVCGGDGGRGLTWSDKLIWISVNYWQLLTVNSTETSWLLYLGIQWPPSITIFNAGLTMKPHLDLIPYPIYHLALALSVRLYPYIYHYKRNARTYSRYCIWGDCKPMEVSFLSFEKINVSSSDYGTFIVYFYQFLYLSLERSTYWVLAWNIWS